MTWTALAILAMFVLEPASQACGLTWILRPGNHTFQRTQDPLAPWRVRPLSLIQEVIAHVARALRRLHP